MKESIQSFFQKEEWDALMDENKVLCETVMNCPLQVDETISVEGENKEHENA